MGLRQARADSASHQNSVHALEAGAGGAACRQPSRLLTWRTCGVPSAQGGAEQGASAATTSAASCLQAPKLGL